MRRLFPASRGLVLCTGARFDANRGGPKFQIGVTGISATCAKAIAAWDGKCGK